MSKLSVRAALAAALVLLGWLMGGWMVSALLLVACVPFVVRTQDGRIWWSAISTRLRFRFASARGLTAFSDDDGLPGPLADTRVVQHEPFAVLADAHDRLSIVVPFDPDRTAWLNRIADSGLLAASITTQTGSLLASGFTIDASAGALTRSVLREALPVTSSLPAAWVCLTWDGEGRNLAEITVGIAEFLARSGLGQPLSGAQIAALAGLAYNPDREPSTAWEEAGPGSAHEHWNRYDHAGMTSLVWRTAGAAAHTAALLSDTTGASVERVTAVYRPQPVGDRLRQSVVITITVPAGDPEALGRAAAAVRARAATAGAALAPAAGAMASSFQVGMGIGVLPAQARP